MHVAWVLDLLSQLVHGHGVLDKVEAASQGVLFANLLLTLKVEVSANTVLLVIFERAHVHIFVGIVDDASAMHLLIEDLTFVPLTVRKVNRTLPQLVVMESADVGALLLSVEVLALAVELSINKFTLIDVTSGRRELAVARLGALAVLTLVAHRAKLEQLNAMTMLLILHPVTIVKRARVL